MGWGKELAQHRPEIANKDASDLCEKGLCEGSGKAEATFAPSSKIGFHFPSGKQLWAVF